MAEEEKKQESVETAEAKSEQSQPAPKRKHKKGAIVGVTIVIIVVALGIGMFAWHTTPNFCGTFCHDTMNEHLTNYQGTDDSQGAGLAHAHQAADVTCLDCHKADLHTQASEAEIQVFHNPGNVELTSTYYVDNQTCLDCHGGSYEALAKTTEVLGDYNPHANPHGQMNCNECHKGHSAQVDTCGQCHENGGQTMRS